MVWGWPRMHILHSSHLPCNFYHWHFMIQLQELEVWHDVTGQKDTAWTDRYEYWNSYEDVLSSKCRIHITAAITFQTFLFKGQLHFSFGYLQCTIPHFIFGLFSKTLCTSGKCRLFDIANIFLAKPKSALHTVGSTAVLQNIYHYFHRNRLS